MGLHTYIHGRGSTHKHNITVLLLQCLKVTFNNEFSGIEKITHTHTPTVHAHTTRTNLCVPWLPSLQCNDDWVSPLDWLHSCTTIPLSTVRNHLVSLGLLQSNWPFKEGLYHVKQCNWEWSSLRSVPYFVLLPSTLVFLSVCGPPFSPFRAAAPSVSLPLNIVFLLHLVFGWLLLTSKSSVL